MLATARLLASVALSAAGAPPATAAASGGAPCSAASDCNLNGVCSGGKCSCDGWWAGPACGVLNLLPAPRNGGYRHPTTSSWGGNVWRNASDGMHHLFVSEFAPHCGLNAWGQNSRIVHATSRSPVGPFAFVEEALPPQAHNAHIARDPKNGTFLLYHIHTPSLTDPCVSCRTDCTNGSTPKGAGGAAAVAAPRGVVGPTSSVLHTSASIHGPWAGVRPPDGHQVGCNNPSPWFRADGSVVLTCTGGYKVTIAEAPSWYGPYGPPTSVPCAINGTEIHWEDAVGWIDARGSYHAIGHSLSVPPGPGGIHAFSADGARWACTQELVFSMTVQFDDGTNWTMGRRERPKLVFAADGTTPVALLTAVCPWCSHHWDDYTYTLAQPLGASGA